jgi:hypothetical protein
MSRNMKETAYYFNGRLPRIALIAKGVRFPEGQWLWVAACSLTPWLVEALVRDLFPVVKYANLPFSVLLTDFDVDEFEQQTGNRSAGG